MNIMVISDDHGIDGFKDAYRKAAAKYGCVDAVIHAGDSERSNLSYYKEICNCPLYAVRGNNDFGDLPAEIQFNLGGKHFFVTHGHKYGVYMGLMNIAYAAQEKNADVLVYGHTHHANHQSWQGIEIINPGSLTGVRSGTGSYIVLSVEGENVKINFEYAEKD